MAIECTPDSLAHAARCYCGLAQNEIQYRSVFLYLLCQIANNPGGGGQSCLFCDDADPGAFVPDCPCALWVNKTTSDVFVWNDDTAQWEGVIV